MVADIVHRKLVTLGIPLPMLTYTVKAGGIQANLFCLAVLQILFLDTNRPHLLALSGGAKAHTTNPGHGEVL
jgi:hypothetical protein